MEDSVLVYGKPATGPVATAMRALWQLLGSALQRTGEARKQCLLSGLRDALRHAEDAPQQAREVLLSAYQDIGRWPEIRYNEMQIRLMRTLDELGRLYCNPPAEPNGNPDVIIPLGNGSHTGNTELRMLLRSMEVNLKDHGRIFLVTHYVPDWLDRNQVIVVDIDDVYKNNKDANLHRKTLETVRRYGIDHFVWCADDNCFMRPVRAAEIPDIHTGREASWFSKDTYWHQRMRNTLDWASKHNEDVRVSHEVHVPQLFEGPRLLEGMRKVDYVTAPGLTIYTTWRTVLGTYRNAVLCTPYRTTVENNEKDALSKQTDEMLQAKMFLCYGDKAVNAGLLNRLAKIFPDKSKYERR